MFGGIDSIECDDAYNLISILYIYIYVCSVYMSVYMYDQNSCYLLVWHHTFQKTNVPNLVGYVFIT